MESTPASPVSPRSESSIAAAPAAGFSTPTRMQAAEYSFSTPTGRLQSPTPLMNSPATLQLQECLSKIQLKFESQDKFELMKNLLLSLAEKPIHNVALGGSMALALRALSEDTIDVDNIRVPDDLDFFISEEQFFDVKFFLNQHGFIHTDTQDLKRPTQAFKNSDVGVDVFMSADLGHKRKTDFAIPDFRKNIENFSNSLPILSIEASKKLLNRRLSDGFVKPQNAKADLTLLNALKNTFPKIETQAAEESLGSPVVNRLVPRNNTPTPWLSFNF